MGPGTNGRGKTNMLPQLQKLEEHGDCGKLPQFQSWGSMRLWQPHHMHKPPEFYGGLVYKFKKLIGRNDFSFQLRKIITRYRRIGYNLNVM